MEILLFFRWLNEDILALPATILFLGTGIWFTFKSRFIQFRAFGRFIRMISSGFKRKEQTDTTGHVETMSGFNALFTAMATSIGTGSIVAPSLAIIAGGPGALFWLIIYLFFGSVTKFTEAVFAMHTREFTGDQKKLVGGPMQYLRVIHPWLAAWYGTIMLLLYFFGWQTVQANTLANIYAQEHVPHWVVGLVLAFSTYYILSGGARLVGHVASKVVPGMFLLYVCFSFYILGQDISLVWQALKLIVTDALTPSAIFGGIAAQTMFASMHAGVYRGIFISEAGLGTSSIAHAMADTKNGRDQAILAMYSTIADVILSLISGLLILVTNVWMQQTSLKATLIYDVFKLYVPGVGQIVLLLSITLFVFTTVLGNGFNGMQIFATFTKFRWIKVYIAAISAVVFIGALMPVPLVWAMMDTLLALATIPNLLGLLILSARKPELLK